MYKLCDEIERLIYNLIEEMDTNEDQAYENLEKISKLLDIKERVEIKKDPSLIEELIKSPVFIGGVVQLVATLLVIHNERVGIITSRAFQWIRFK